MGENSSCDESYQTSEDVFVPSSISSAENTHSICSTKLTRLWHWEAPHQLHPCSLTLNRVEEHTIYLTGILFAVIVFITFFLCPIFKLLLKLGLFQPAPFLEHRQHQNWTFPLSQVLWFFFLQHQTSVPVLKNDYFKRAWTWLWTFMIIWGSHINVIAAFLYINTCRKGQ